MSWAYSHFRRPDRRSWCCQGQGTSYPAARGTTTLKMPADAAERAREEGLTAERSQGREGCEEGEGRPERFGLSFQLALVTSYLLQQG